MILAVDFDGTIARSSFPDILGEQPYAGEVLRKLHERGHYIIIWTCRSGKNLLDAINWLLEHNIPFDRVNDHCPENIKRYGKGSGKIYANINMQNAVNIGMFPDIPIEKFHYIGNSSLTGAYLMLLSTPAEKKTYELAANMTYMELLRT